MNREVPSKKLILAADIYAAVTFVLGLTLLFTGAALVLIVLVATFLIFGGAFSLNLLRKVFTNWFTSIAMGKQFQQPARRVPERRRVEAEEEADEPEIEEVPEVKRTRGRPRKSFWPPTVAQQKSESAPQRIVPQPKPIVAEATPPQTEPLDFDDVMRIVYSGEGVEKVSNSSTDKKGFLDRFKKNEG